MPNGISEILITMAWLAGLAWLVGKLSLTKNLPLSPNQLRLLFIFKVLVGIGLAIFYEVYYADRGGSDAFRFFDDALIIFSSFKISPTTYFDILFGLNMESPEVVAVVDKMNNWYKLHLHGIFNDNQTIIRFNALVLLVSGGVYHVHTVIASFLSFTGFLALFSAFKKWGNTNKWLLLLMILFPQVLLWSSGVLKESLLFFALGWFIYYLTQLVNGKWNKGIYIGLVLSIFAMYLIKNYVLVCLIPGIVILLISQIIPQLKKIRIAFATLMLMLAMVVSADVLMGSSRSNSIVQKQVDFIREAEIGNAGSYFQSFVLERSWSSILKNSPEAVFNTLARPFIWRAHNIVSKVASVESLVICLFLVLTLLFYKPPRAEIKIWISFSLAFTLLLFVLIGLTTPVAGALVRYKTPAIPFLLFVLWQVFDVERLKKILGLSKLTS